MIHNKEHLFMMTCYLVVLGSALIHAVRYAMLRRRLGGDFVDEYGIVADVFTSSAMFLGFILFIEYMFVR